MNTIADSLSPEVIEQLSSNWIADLNYVDVDSHPESFIEDEWVEHQLGMVTGEHLWHQAWLFGIVVDDDLNYYIPNDYDTSVPLVALSQA
jgi:hypothetical protein